MADARFEDLAIGTNWLDDELNPFVLTPGSHPPSSADEVVIDKRSADRAGYTIGDRARVQTSSGLYDVTITGIARLGTADSPGIASLVMFATEDAPDLLGTPGRTRTIWAVGDPGLDQDELSRRVADALDEGDVTNAEAVRGRDFTADVVDDGVRELQFYTRPIITFSYVAVFVGGLVIATSLSFAAAQRRRELALLRLVGASRRQVVGLVLGEAAVVGTLASIVGCVAGVVVATTLQRLIATTQLEVRPAALAVRPSSVVLAAATGMAVTVVAALVPAWHSASLSPLAAQREFELDHRVRRGPRLVAAFALVAVGAGLLARGYGRGTVDVSAIALPFGTILAATVIIGPLVVRSSAHHLGRLLHRARGIAGHLAGDNAVRNPRRSALTASALTVGLAVVIYMLMMDSAQAALRTRFRQERSTVREESEVDFFVTASHGASLPLSLVEDLRGLPEVLAASDPRYAFVVLDDEEEVLSAVDPVHELDLGLNTLVAGDPDDLGESGLAVAADRAEHEGWRIGDELPLTLPTAGGAQDEPDAAAATWTIVALYDYPGVTGAEADELPLLASSAAFDRWVPDAETADIAIRLADTVDDEDGRAALQSVVGRYPLARLYSPTADPEEVSGADDEGFDPYAITRQTTNALLALTFVVAFTGIVNAQVLSTIERQREIALLRAVGATPGQVRSAVRWETVLVSLVGAVMAVAVGIPLSLAVIHVQQPFYPAAVPALALAGLTVLAVAVAFVAAIVPAWWATRRIGPLTGLGRIG